MPIIHKVVLDTLSFAHHGELPSWDEYRTITRECSDAVKAAVGDES